MNLQITKLMVEVFRTNVTEICHAEMLIEQIHKTFSEYKANFDLKDCDKILRVKCANGAVRPAPLISLLNDFGFFAEVLPDEVAPIGSLHLDRSTR